MRKLMFTVTAMSAILFTGSLAWQAAAQTTRGAASIGIAAQNFTPIEKAACGPYWGRHCGPFHHWVCGPYRCWCARC